MARINVAEAQAWLESTKGNLNNALDGNLLGNLEEEVLDELAAVYDTSTWSDPTNTPKLVRTIISKMYAGWFYMRQYSEDTDAKNPYAQSLLDNARMLMDGLLDGSITLPGVPTAISGQITFYPDDASSATDPRTSDDPSVGPAAFSMTTRF
jgi:hypothetical protein